MNKKLPNVYAVPIDKKLENNEEIFLSNKKEENRGEKISITEINKIFNSKTHVYKTRANLKLQNEEKIVDIIGLQGNNLLTLKGEKIPVDEIIEIKKV